MSDDPFQQWLDIAAALPNHCQPLDDEACWEFRPALVLRPLVISGDRLFTPRPITLRPR
jgi:hypothetical protein